MNNGEKLCPLKDDRDRLIGKIISSDGVVLSLPHQITLKVKKNYA